MQQRAIQNEEKAILTTKSTACDFIYQPPVRPAGFNSTTKQVSAVSCGDE